MYNKQFVNVLIGCIMSHIVIGTLANRQIIKLLHMNRICNLFGIKYPIIQEEWYGVAVGDWPPQ